MDKSTTWRSFCDYLRSPGNIFDVYHASTNEYGAVEGDVFALWMQTLAPINHKNPIKVGQGQTSIYTMTIGAVVNGAPVDANATKQAIIMEAEAIFDRAFKVRPESNFI